MKFDLRTVATILVYRIQNSQHRCQISIFEFIKFIKERPFWICLCVFFSFGLWHSIGLTLQQQWWQSFVSQIFIRMVVRYREYLKEAAKHHFHRKSSLKSFFFFQYCPTMANRQWGSVFELQEKVECEHNEAAIDKIMQSTMTSANKSLDEIKDSIAQIDENISKIWDKIGETASE